MSAPGRKPKLPDIPVQVTIESLSHDGRGVAHVDGKAVFVDGALPGEAVSFVYTRRSRNYDEGRVCEIVSASDHRVEPRCPHFSICGGCSLQHLAPAQQILAKQQTLLDNLARIGRVEPAALLPPLTGPHWHYRCKARLGVKFVRKKARVLVGFREKRSAYLADLSRCEVLHASVGSRLHELAGLVQELEARQRIPQIEVAVGEDAGALVFRHLDPLSAADRKRLSRYGEDSGLHIHLQAKGPDSVELLYPAQSRLRYRLPAYDIDIDFRPTDFTQVNPLINRAMIDQALALMDLSGEDRVLDLYCGLGNFTLPLARGAASVTGVEGDAGLVERARHNARHNSIDNVSFRVADLGVEAQARDWADGRYSKILLDPPRSGAAALIPALAAVGAQRIVYVSCHPDSLARDAGALVNEHGYRLAAAGVMDMFPHTTHVESMALFERRCRIP